MTHSSSISDRERCIDVSAAAFKPELIAIDVDHTLITDDHELTDATIAAVQDAVREGVRVVLASSRPPRGMEQILRRLGLTPPIPFVSLQGGLIAELDATGIVSLESTPIELADAREVLQLAEDAGLTVNWYTGTRWLVSAVNEQIEREAAIVGFDPEVVDLSAEVAPPEKILLMAPPSVAAEICTPAGLDAQRSNPSYVEITRLGVSKASAIHELARRFGVDLARSVAIGDGENDLALFDIVGLSIAPENAPAAIRAQASVLTKSNNDDGVAAAIVALLAAG